MIVVIIIVIITIIIIISTGVVIFQLLESIRDLEEVSITQLKRIDASPNHFEDGTDDHFVVIQQLFLLTPFGLDECCLLVDCIDIVFDLLQFQLSLQRGWRNEIRENIYGKDEKERKRIPHRAVQWLG